MLMLASRCCIFLGLCCTTLQCHAFLSRQATNSLAFGKGLIIDSSPRSLVGMVATDPVRRRKHGQSSESSNRIRPKESFKRQRRPQSIEELANRWRVASKIEGQLIESLNIIRQGTESEETVMLFPSVRDCNAALATFGDGGDLLRALRLFFKMRKVTALVAKQHGHLVCIPSAPAPTLVTYSTLMSRAVQVGKPLVALRLWKLMTLQAEFFSTPASKPEDVAIIPDVKAANILMNAYAKLADHDSAQKLLEEMLSGNGTDVPRMTPNLVTYNTLLDACHKAGELDHALAVKEQLDKSGLKPDARTYTSLIACVARKPSVASGVNDPSMAFVLLQEMLARGVRPNSVLYCALIDVCGRCRRSDLALKGLRTMLRQDRNEENDNSVGAWTAAINACGKAGRIQTALRLFRSMPKFGVKPNTITCGCLTDCLLKNRRTAETLHVLRYMKHEGIAPSEVMYTSLMTSAGRLAQAENRKQWEDERQFPQQIDKEVSLNKTDAKAIEIYTELMSSLMRGPKSQSNNKKDLTVAHKRNANDANTLVKVFLVFQEMKASGATPDLACYNALLQACARAGDVARASEVLARLREDGLDPSDTTWREMIRAAGKARRSDVAESIWNRALGYQVSEDKIRAKWKPSHKSFGALISAFMQHASSLDERKHFKEKRAILSKAVSMYASILTGDSGFLINLDRIHKDERVMLLVLQAIVALERLCGLTGTHDDLKQMQALRQLGKSVVLLDCFHSGVPPNLRNRWSLDAFHRARTWLTHR